MSDDDNKIPTDKEKQFTLRANLSVNTEEGNVGAGMLAVHMDRGLLKLREIEEKKQRAAKSFNSMLARIEARMAELDEQIEYWDGVANDAQEEIDRLKAEQAEMEEGSDEWKAKQKEIDEQVRIREEALDNKRIAQAEKDALEKTHEQALGISNALDDIGAKKAGLDTTAASLVGKLNSIEKRMNGAGMDDVSVLALMNGTYEPSTPEQEALIDEYEEAKKEIEALEVEIEILDKKLDVQHEQIQENQKTVDGLVKNFEIGSNVLSLENAETVFVTMGENKEDASDISVFVATDEWGSFSVDQQESSSTEQNMNPSYDVVADGNISTPKIDLTKSYADAANGVIGTIQEPEVLAKQDGKGSVQNSVSFQ